MMGKIVMIANECHSTIYVASGLGRSDFSDLTVLLLHLV